MIAIFLIYFCEIIVIYKYRIKESQKCYNNNMILYLRLRPRIINILINSISREIVAILIIK